ncbi:MAG TPA: hypothetical protein PK639_00465 [Candidatus Woesebacteria bacterium]|nr:hypothetical protein [Candidatus Woesebacteria bacterium]
MNQDYGAGEFVTDSSYIYQVTEVKLVKDNKGKEEYYMYYKPAWGSDKVYTASIPIENLKKTGIRKMLTTDEIKKVYKDLKNKEIEAEYNSLVIKEMIFSNNLESIVSVLIYYWIRMATLTKTDLEIVEQMMARLCQEISMVTKKEPSVIRGEIESILKKRS